MSRLEWNFSSEGSFGRKERPVVEADNVPRVLKPLAQWVCWSYVFRGEGIKPDKQPKNPHNLHNAGVHWPNTWSAFNQAYTTYLRHRSDGIAGIGFVLTDDPFVAVDIDDCLSEDSITEPAAEVIQTLQSYTEVSPSGRGIRILVSSPTPVDNFKSSELEIYSNKRYVTITGHRLDNSPQEINRVDPRILQSLRPPQVPATIPTPHEGKPFTGSDAQLWEQIFRFDQYGTQHQRRFHGDISLDHEDASLTMLRLLNALARWTNGDPVRMRQAILTSSLVNDKWFTKRGNVDYLDYQIANAINYVQGKK
jgi:primase-polymerase (primpol)-like protein